MAIVVMMAISVEGHSAAALSAFALVDYLFASIFRFFFSAAHLDPAVNRILDRVTLDIFPPAVVRLAIRLRGTDVHVAVLSVVAPRFCPKRGDVVAADEDHH